MTTKKKFRNARPATRQSTGFSIPLLLASALFWTYPCSATSIIPLDLNQLVEQADLVFEGTVIDLQVHATGGDSKTSAPKNHVAPQRPPIDDKADVDSPAEEASAIVAAPVGLGVEGGRMLFTHVTMTVDHDIVGGSGSSTVTFKVAGGTDGQTEVTVYGMPQFNLGQRYVVFLRPDYPLTAVPIVGVNQGFFKIVADASNGDLLLNADDDIVIGIENDAVMLRRNTAKNASEPVRHRAPPPTPSAGSGVTAEASPEVERYFNSNEPSMTVREFARTISAMKGGQP